MKWWMRKVGQGRKGWKGFSTKWRSWMRGCLSSTSFAVLVNRNAKEDFLWSGIRKGKKDYLISWDVVYRPKEFGGLGIGKTALRNRALLGKWLWRFPRESSGLWHQVISSIYGTHTNGWDANIMVRWSHQMSLEGYCSSLSGLFPLHPSCGRE
ncbi:hypothetical protein CK203_072965 [Vitis vinifera]|uniref:Uncharacterized protein n=1 Tax=Vitis vinifera TaxID=29760 RepID=A0A438F1V5_VITVI|nr:hypothetical protein CK203_072965 [Vitis vinifera]